MGAGEPQDRREGVPPRIPDALPTVPACPVVGPLGKRTPHSEGHPKTLGAAHQLCTLIRSVSGPGWARSQNSNLNHFFV